MAMMGRTQEEISPMTSPGIPSRQALEFGRTHAQVLRRWSEFFAAAAALAEANVELGEAYSAGADEFEKWVRTASAGPSAWFSADSMKRWADLFAVGGEQGERSTP